MSIQARNPCKFCKPPTRYPGCHGECEKHQAWITEFRELQEQIYAERNKRIKLDKYEKENALKIRKRTRKEK